jgi:hypothetical protein
MGSQRDAAQSKGPRRPFDLCPLGRRLPKSLTTENPALEAEVLRAQARGGARRGRPRRVGFASLARGVEFDALMAVVRRLGELTDTAGAVSMDAAQSAPQQLMVQGRDPQSGAVYTSAISPKQWAMAMELQRRMAKRSRPVAAPIVSPPARAREVAPRRQVATVSRSDGGALGGDSGDPSRPRAFDLAGLRRSTNVDRPASERGGVH